MNTPHNFDELQKALTPGEALLMREHELESSKILVRQYVQAHPATAPWHIRAQDALMSGDLGRTSYFQPAFAAVFAVLMIGSGTSYAAENALPGDVLYPIKTVVNEGVRAAIAVSPTAQVEWQTERVSRRLSEVQVLAEKDALTPAITAAIEHDVTDAADVIDSHHEVATEASTMNAADIPIAPQAAPMALRAVAAKSDSRGKGSSAISEKVRTLDAAVASDKSTTTREEVAAIVAHVRGRFHTDNEGDDVDTVGTSLAQDASSSSDAGRATVAARVRGDDGEGRRGKRGASTVTLMSASATTSSSTPSIIPAINLGGLGDDGLEIED